VSRLPDADEAKVPNGSVLSYFSAAALYYLQHHHWHHFQRMDQCSLVLPGYIIAQAQFKMALGVTGSTRGNCPKE